MSDSPSELNRRASELRPTLYPELQHEAYHALVRRLIVDAGYVLEEGDGFRAGDRFAQVSHAALERLFMFDLWCKGVCYGQGQTEDPRAMADAIGAFVVGGASVEEMHRRFPWVRFGEVARAHEAGRLVDETWRWRLERSDELGQLLRPLIEACARRSRLRALLPFTSLNTLLFSRTTGYPYDSMVACARPVHDPMRTGRYVEQFVPGTYEVFVRSREPTAPADRAPQSFGTGDADWAAAALERQVPPSWGPAVDGTKEDEPSTSSGTTPT